jgi:hypothetical protein
LIAKKMLDEVQNSSSLSDDIKRRQVLKSLIRMYNWRFANWFARDAGSQAAE